MKKLSGSKKVAVAVVCVIVILGLYIYSIAGDEPLADIVDTAISAGKFNTLVAALQAADLVETLKGEGPFTVFAPTDKAFETLPAGTVEDLLKPANKSKLAAILTYHVISGEIMSKDLLKLNSTSTVQGSSVSLGLALDNARVVQADIQCSNGVIHVIDSVILPREKTTEKPSKEDIIDTAVSAGSFKTLAAALQAANLIETLKGKGPFTVFAPTDAAFAKLPQGTVESLLQPSNKDKLTQILTYHVVPGIVNADEVMKSSYLRTVQGQPVSVNISNGKCMIDNASVIKADIYCSNGVIHVIDSVILPGDSNRDIVDILASNRRFSTLVTAVKAAGLVDTLKSDGPFTVFAPTDEAFKKLPAGVLGDLLKAENKKQLTDILTYHVVAGKVMSDQVLSLTRAQTVQGQEVSVSPTIDGAKIIFTDIAASNGVIHVLDEVILPTK